MRYKNLLNALKGKGYTGTESVDEVLAFVKSEGIEFAGQDGKTLTDDDIRALAAKKVKITIAADNGEEVEIEGGAMPDDEKEYEEDEDQKRIRPAASRKAAINSVTRELHAPSIRSERGRAAKRYSQRVQQHGVGKGASQAKFSDPEIAESFAAKFRLWLAGPNDYSQKNADRDIVGKAHTGDNFNQGGAFVMGEWRPEIIHLIEQYGVARRLAGVTPMSNHTLTVFRNNTGSIQVNWTNEAQAITPSNLSTDQVQLVANQLKGLGALSNEILNDNAVEVADAIASEFAQAFAIKEDTAYLRGDGTAATGGFTGVLESILDVDGTPANILALHDSGVTAWANITGAMIRAVYGKAMHFGAANAEKIVCHKQFYHQVIVPALRVPITGTTVADSGSTFGGHGTDADAIADGIPVYFSPAMPAVVSAPTGQNRIPMVYGAFERASKFGEVRGGMQLATSEHFRFGDDVLSVRATNRVAVNVHDVGSTTVRSPLVGLFVRQS